MADSRSHGESGTVIVLSNRLPYNFPERDSKQTPKRNVGGLVNALEPVLAVRRGCWIGWDGAALPSTSAVQARLVEPPSMRAESGVHLLGIPLSERELSRYYHGFSNRTLWPLCHNLLDKTVFEVEDYATYVKINLRFAEAAMGRATEADRIWVHDYQLMLVPRMLRDMGFHGRIDFFLHIPFPAPEIFRALPWRHEILQGMLGADSVAFHVDSYLDNFVRTAGSFGDISVHKSEGDVLLRHHAGMTCAGTAPIGVEVDEFERISELPAVQEKAAKLLRAYGDVALIFGADRLDYTKGIKERLLAVERLLVKYPRLAGRFVLLQVVVPSRHQVDEYRRLKREIDEHVGRINGGHSRDDWTPVHYVYRALEREDLVARYRAAAAALITPLIDGMNLVAPEFVASRTDNDGVLILSEFAGVATYLPEALRVNPYDVDECADAIAAALEMPAEERAARMKSLRARVHRNTITNWAERCMTLGEPPSPVATNTSGGPASETRH